MPHTPILPPDDGPAIDIDEPQDVRYWSEHLGCTPSALREAVDEVGSSIAAIEEYLAEGEE